MKNKISHYCQIKGGNVVLDNQLLFSSKTTNFLEFIKEVYKKEEVNYPKFYKMDPLCKLSTVAASILFDNTTEKVSSDCAIILGNKSSCIDVDKKHLAAIQQENGYASPADFVYTLPNIALGEISIKYKLTSENSFFIFDAFKASFFVDYASNLIDSQRCEAVLCGWVEVNKNEYNALLFTVEAKNKNGIGMETNKLQNLI